MADSDDGPLSGFPDDVRELISAAPVADKRLLEVAVAWSRAKPTVARMAEATRVFLLTWDPLEWLGPRPDAFATVNAASPGLELVVYAPLWSVLKRAATDATTAAAVLEAMAGSAVAVAAANQDAVRAERYPLLLRAGSVPALLSEPPGGAGRGDPAWRLVSHGWEPIGLGAITDIVQDAFGPVALDRSPVELAPIPAPHRSCPACQGRRFDFPGELNEAVALMCPGHQRQAGSVTNARLEAARTSNPDGWGALGVACERLERPHLPNGLASNLAGAERAMVEVPEPAELRARAQQLIEAAGWFPGRAEDLAVALGAQPDMPWLPDWLVNMVLDLGRAGLGEQAAAVADALASVDSDHQSLYQADAGVALAEAGQHEQARARVAANLDAWPDDFWVRVHAGDALAALGDRPGAAAHFLAALDLAEETNDFEARADAVDRLATLEGATGRPDHRLKVGIPSSAARPGRNSPCPCQSGRKYKHCHGKRQ
jgi:tetratricopeptide (TPR) repeat protein